MPARTVGEQVAATLYSEGNPNGSDAIIKFGV
jgi:hypothetical protein